MELFFFFSDVDTLAKRVREAMAEQVVCVCVVCVGGSRSGGVGGGAS